jgi:oligogalacturonate-specific porin family protein
MKKTLSIAVTAALLSSTAFAGTFAEVSQATDNETAVKVGHGLENGISFGIEGVYSNNGFNDVLGNKKANGYKETTLGAAWKVSLTDNVWVQPQIGYTIASENFSAKATNIGKAGNSTEYRVSGEKGDTLKLGLKSGYDFDNGMYVAGRYRYDMRTDSMNLLIDNNKGKLEGDVNVHRTDLTFGYKMEVVDLSMNWVHKEAEDKFNLIDGKKGKRSKTRSLAKGKVKDASADEFEFKATLLTANNLKPYVQYTVKNDINVKGVAKNISKDDVFKLGVAYSF